MGAMSERSSGVVETRGRRAGTGAVGRPAELSGVALTPEAPPVAAALRNSPAEIMLPHGLPPR
jgi:hypothetical protein